jgi:glutathione S-transferase
MNASTSAWFRGVEELVVRARSRSTLAAPMLTLHGEANFDSPFVFTVFVALAHKKIPFQVRVVDLARGEQRSPEFVKRSLTGRVPTIEDGDFSLSESLAILEYLDETRPPPAPQLFPPDLRQRSRARQLLGWLRSSLHSLKNERPSSSLFFESAQAPLGTAAKTDAETLGRISESLLEADSAHLFGDFTIADADLAFALMRLIKNGDALPERLRAYAERVWAHPSVARFVALDRPATQNVLGPF